MMMINVPASFGDWFAFAFVVSVVSSTALCAVNEKLNGLDCSCVLLPAALVMTIYTLVGISYMRVILRGGAGKNGSTVAVRLLFLTMS